MTEMVDQVLDESVGLSGCEVGDMVKRQRLAALSPVVRDTSLGPLEATSS